MKNPSSTKTSELLQRRRAPLATRTDLDASATKDIAGAMNAILADVFALYLKTKNFHWHMSGRHFRDYHLLSMSRPISSSPWLIPPRSAYGSSAARR